MIKEPQMQIKAENIKSANAKELNKFKILFHRDTNIKPKNTI